MTNDHKLCPFCQASLLVETEYKRHESIGEHSFVIRGLQHSVCSNCDARVTDSTQSRHNKKVIIGARAVAVAERDATEKLAPVDILRIRKKLSLTQAQASRVFGGGPVAFSKYESGTVEPSEGMERLLRVADSIPAAASWLLNRAGLLHGSAHEIHLALSQTHAYVVAFESHARKNRSGAYSWTAGARFPAAVPTPFNVEPEPFRRGFVFSLTAAANESDIYAPPDRSAVG